MGVKTGSLSSPCLCLAFRPHDYFPLPRIAASGLHPLRCTSDECPKMLTHSPGQVTWFHLVPVAVVLAPRVLHTATAPSGTSPRPTSSHLPRPPAYALPVLPPSAFFCTSVITTVPRESCLITYFYMSALSLAALLLQHTLLFSEPRMSLAALPLASFCEAFWADLAAFPLFLYVAR